MVDHQIRTRALSGDVSLLALRVGMAERGKVWSQWLLLDGATTITGEVKDSLKAGKQLFQCRACMISQGMSYSDEDCCGNPEEGGSVGVSDPANIHGEEGRLRLMLDRGGVSWGRPQER